MCTRDNNSVLEELQLIRYSLLPDERIDFSEDSSSWLEALDKLDEDSLTHVPTFNDLPSVSIRIRDVRPTFNITYTPDLPVISVKGDISRGEQETWNSMVKERRKEFSGYDFPVYQLLSSLLPLFRGASGMIRQPLHGQKESASGTTQSTEAQLYHVLFTSHHLLSPTKRRSLQTWSSALRLSGFSKVGHPGIIYAQGGRSNIEEFVGNVKAMQWLALKVRFVEPLPATSNKGDAGARYEAQWKEFQKVGEVVEEMRVLGREAYVVEMGIGSAGSQVRGH